MAAKKAPETAKKRPETRKKVSESLTNFQALQATIEALRSSGKLDKIDEARIRICLGLAAAVDSMPDNPSLWREYRAAEKALREEASAHGDPFDQLLASISAEIRDEEKQEKPNPRTRSRGDS
jgi:hypothetical protein